jgi:hypothetical protein
MTWQPLILAAAQPNDFWYAAPLVVVVSLVYAATRHEVFNRILFHAARVALWGFGLLAAVFVLLYLIS